METRIRQLDELGMDGVEVVLSRAYDGDERETPADRPRKYHMLVTGGSDFHGTAKTQPDWLCGAWHCQTFLQTASPQCC